MWIDRLGPHAPVRYCNLAAIFAEGQGGREPRGDISERLRAALLDSVRHHLVGDVPIGLFLSAGVDSGALLGLIRETRRDIHAITVEHEEFRGAPRCEADAAAQIAAQHGVPHTRRTVSEAEFQADLPRILDQMDQPSIDGINTWFASKAAGELGLKVALSGLGGDELFGGYPSFVDVPRWVRLIALPSRIPLLGEAFRLAVSALRCVRPAISPKAAGLMKYAGTYAGAYLLRRGVFMPWELEDVMAAAHEGLRRLDPLRLIAAAGAGGVRSPMGKVAALEAGLYLRNQLLRDTDWAGMAHSVEVRVPLVDIELTRAVGADLMALQPGEGKRLLAASPRPHLLREVADAPKRGFETPIAQWMQQDARLPGVAPPSRTERTHLPVGATMGVPACRGLTEASVKLLALVGDALGGRGGIARYTRDLLTALASAERTRIIVLPREGRVGHATLPRGLQQRRPRGRIGFVLAALWTGWRERPFDAVFCGHLNLAPVAAIVAALFRLPLWLQLHGVEAWVPLSRAQHRAAERAALITAVSRYTRHRFLGLARIAPWRLRVLPNTVDASFAPGPKPEYLLNRHGLYGKAVLLTVGRLHSTEPGKGHDRVIAALPALAASRSDIIYLIIGDGSDRARLAALATANGVADRVVFAGVVCAAELPDYYRAADLFVMPSVQEGFGIVLLEAAASGLPVIAGNADGSIDALADGNLGRLIDPHDPAALVRAIEEMLGSIPPRAELIERYAFPQFAERAAMLLDEVVASSREFVKAG